MTLEELVWAHRATKSERWDHTAFICATVVQAFTGASDISLEDFHPIKAAERRAKSIPASAVPKFLPETLSPEEIDRRWEVYERERFRR